MDKRLQGRLSGCRSVRFGDFRIIHRQRDDGVVVVLRVAPRGRAYRPRAPFSTGEPGRVPRHCSISSAIPMLSFRLEAPRIDGRPGPYGAGPWPERPVSEANKSGK
ncbi:MAG: hypothetical protein F4110_01320 [Acidimicrobiaceae bacterium]|nr:hypothetical protein [Acidimicrobiaceae bacterium]MYE95844.1 hypothetical protein [Acidimicrobiaceae bacterium]MYI52627.1 hypothetical protein [Acidimicrobiaceae bacterium]MYJ43069.1 hypothetical protein [Acidimicrobiaceae bacterium]MYJ81769.1 hypothetical protein [Acidimicrobiaceae bacterium]